MNKIINYSLVSLIILVLVGCQEDSQQESTKEEVSSAQASEEESKEEQENEQSENLVEAINALKPTKVPESAQDIVSQEMGVFNQVKFERNNEEMIEVLEAELAKIPELPEEPTSEEYDAYYEYLYSLNAFQFPDPKDVADQMAFSLSGTPEAGEKYQFKESYNVEIILDASGSMGAMEGSKTRMEHAKDEINAFLSSVPEEANVSLRVYGHKGTGDEADKAMSCEAIEEVYERAPYEKETFSKALDQFEPAGWTPVAGALESAAESFKDLDGENNTNLIYLVSDGIETCDGDPVAAAKSFADSNVSPIINVIGFGADSETQEQLRDVAKEANGIFTNVSNAEELREEFEQTEQILERWKRWKSEAEREVSREDLDNHWAIVRFSNQFNQSNLQQNLSIAKTLDQLFADDKLTITQLKELQKRNSQVDEMISQVEDEMVEDLETLREQGLAEMEQKIEELYPDEAE